VVLKRGAPSPTSRHEWPGEARTTGESTFWGRKADRQLGVSPLLQLREQARRGYKEARRGIIIWKDKVWPILLRQRGLRPVIERRVVLVSNARPVGRLPLPSLPRSATPECAVAYERYGIAEGEGHRDERIGMGASYLLHDYRCVVCAVFSLLLLSGCARYQRRSDRATLRTV